MPEEIPTTSPEKKNDRVAEPESSHEGGSSAGFILLALSPVFFLCGIAFPLMHILGALAFLGFLIWYPFHKMHHPH